MEHACGGFVTDLASGWPDDGYDPDTEEPRIYFWVVCSDVAWGPLGTPDLAWKAVSLFGTTCPYRHEIVTDTIRPLTPRELGTLPHRDPSEDWAYK